MAAIPRTACSWVVMPITLCGGVSPGSIVMGSTTRPLPQPATTTSRKRVMKPQTTPHCLSRIQASLPVRRQRSGGNKNDHRTVGVNEWSLCLDLRIEDENRFLVPRFYTIDLSTEENFTEFGV